MRENQEFQEAKSDSERTKEEMCHIFLKNLPASKFFFLYLLGHNVDYCSLKEIVQKISDIVSKSDDKNCIDNEYDSVPEFPTPWLQYNYEEQDVSPGILG